jgi:transposase
MMGRQKDQQNKLFYSRLNLDKRIRKNHLLRQINRHIDFDFVYNEVKDAYGQRGNVSVPPPVILKIMLLLILYNVRSERELMDTIPERLDWLWFLGYDLDDEIPNHSVLSKARSRWGVSVFQGFFERIVLQCVQANLINGKKVFMDSSNIQADASNNSVVNTQDIKRYMKKSYRLFEKRLEQEYNSSDDDNQTPQKTGVANRKHVSTTDPDASVLRQGGGRSKLRYKVHRSVDEKNEIITATTVTTGSVNEAHMLEPLLEAHEKTTGVRARVCVADSKYGTKENYLKCYDHGINGHFDPVEKSHRGHGRRKGILPTDEFVYRPETDTIICPEGEELTRRNFSKKRQQWEYTAPQKKCKICPLQPRCTRSKTGRSIKRHFRQDDLDKMLAHCETEQSQQDIRKRQHLMERSFARSTRYGFKRARWRRLWRLKIQELITASIQNILVYVSNVKEPRKAEASRVVSYPVNQCLKSWNSWLYAQLSKKGGNLLPRISVSAIVPVAV